MDANAVPRNGTGTEAIDRALDVLDALADANAPVGVTALARSLGLPKSTVHRLLTALVRRGLVEQADSGYRLGMRLVALGLGVLASLPVVEASEPVLEALARELGETCFVVGARGGKLVVLAKAEGTGLLRAAPRVGAEVPVHATAAGRLYLALDPSAVRMPREPFTAYTPCTPTTARELDERVARVRATGLDANVGEWVEGLAVVSAPLVHAGRLAGVLACAMPTPRYEKDTASRATERLRAAATRIVKRLEGKVT